MWYGFARRSEAKAAGSLAEGAVITRTVQAAIMGNEHESTPINPFRKKMIRPKILKNPQIIGKAGENHEKTPSK